MPKIAIIILNWNRPQLTIGTITSLLKINHSRFSYHIFLIDNDSTDKSQKLFQKKYKNHRQISLFSTKQNLGFVEGNNFAIRHALKKNYRFILVCNNDVLVDPNFLQNLLTGIQKNTKTAIVGPKIYFAPGFEFHKNRYRKKQLGRVIWSAGGQMDWDNILGSNIGIDQVDQGQFDKDNSHIDFLSGCCILIRSSALKKIGLFDPAYFMYLEDVDLCQQAKLAKYQITYLPKAKIWHLNSGSSGAGSQLHHYFITRNRLYFAKKYARPRTRFAIFRQSLKTFLSQNHWKRQAVIDYYLGRMGRGSWK